ncbi:hypothetical protein NFI96_004965 [Prochilodus magdalenae]|nr:hypothetical protein NFI96_004965 [Prochilodus magdalenae]
MDYSLDLYTYRVSCMVSGADAVDSGCRYDPSSLRRPPSCWSSLWSSKSWTTATLSWLVFLYGPCNWSKTQQLNSSSQVHPRDSTAALPALASCSCTRTRFKTLRLTEPGMDQRLPPYGNGQGSICTSSPSSFKYSSTRPAIPEDTWRTSVQTLPCPGSQLVERTPTGQSHGLQAQTEDQSLYDALNTGPLFGQRLSSWRVLDSNLPASRGTLSSGTLARLQIRTQRACYSKAVPRRAVCGQTLYPRSGWVLFLKRRTTQSQTPPQDMDIIMESLRQKVQERNHGMKRTVQEENESIMEIMSEELEKMEDEIERKRLKLVKKDKEVERMRRELEEGDEEMDKLRQKLQKRDGEIERMKQKLEEKNEELKRKREQLEEKDEELNKKDEEIDRIRQELDEKDDELEEKDEEIERKRQKLEERGEEIERMRRELERKPEGTVLRRTSSEQWCPPSVILLVQHHRQTAAPRRTTSTQTVTTTVLNTTSPSPKTEVVSYQTVMETPTGPPQSR